jgi:hypothetical protein
VSPALVRKGVRGRRCWRYENLDGLDHVSPVVVDLSSSEGPVELVQHRLPIWVNRS